MSTVATRAGTTSGNGTAASTPTRRRISWGTSLVYLVGIVIAVASVGPVVYAVLGGFRDNGQIAADPVALPGDPWNLEKYELVLTSSNFWRQVFNSTLIAGITTAIVVVFGVMAAFALPVTIVIQRPFLRPFLRALPQELEDAAMIDGCSRLGFFRRIVLPLSGPGMVTVGVLAFVASWNSYLLPLLVLGSPDAQTLPSGTASFSTQYTSDTAAILAFTSLAMLPALVFFLLAQRRIVGGLTGAVKG